MKRLIWLPVAILSTLACSEGDENLGAWSAPTSGQDPEPASPDVSEEPVQPEFVNVPSDQLVQPPAISVVPTPSLPYPEPNPISPIAQRFNDIGPERLLVIQAKVVQLESYVGMPVSGTWWDMAGPGEQILTKVTLLTERAYCGVSPPEESVAAHYLGGTLPIGDFQYGSLMTRDPEINKSYVFFLRKSGQETWIIEGGNKNDILEPVGMDSLRTPAGGTISVTSLMEACP